MTFFIQRCGYMASVLRVSVASIAFVAAIGTTAGCGGDKKPDPKTAAKPTGSAAPIGTSKSTSGAAVDPKAVGDSPTSGTLRIDKEILQACGIKEPEAFFSLDSSAVRKDDLTPLNQVADCFMTGPLKGRTVRLVGRADPRGGHEYNMVLGQARADAVAGYLKSRGMKPTQVESTSRGAMDAQGNDEPSYSKDRRVDVLLGQ